VPNNLTQQELADILAAWSDKQIQLTREVTSAVSNLDVIRTTYQKSIWGRVNEHKSLIVMIVATFCIIAAANYADCGAVFKYGDVSFEKKCD